MKNYFTYVMNKTLKNGYIEYNPMTKRKFFLMPSNPLIKYADEAKYGQLYGFKEKEYNEAYSEVQRLSQNYPIQGEQLLPCLNSVNSVNPKA